MIRITDLTFPNNFSGTLQLCPSCSSLQDAMVLFGIYIQWLSVIVGVFGWYLDSTDRVWRCAGRCGVGRPRNGRLVATEGKQEYHMFWENGCYKVQIKVQYRTVSMPWVCWAYGASGASSYIFVTDSHSLGGVANSRPANLITQEVFSFHFVCLFCQITATWCEKPRHYWDSQGSNAGEKTSHYATVAMHHYRTSFVVRFLLRQRNQASGKHE